MDTTTAHAVTTTPDRDRQPRIVQLANFVHETSGGIRTVLRNLADGYEAAGIRVVQIVPGARTRCHQVNGRRIQTFASPVLPGSGGYRVLVPDRRLRGFLEALRPDAIEVSDRFTLRRVGAWARAADVPATAIAHERFDEVLRQRLPGLAGNTPGEALVRRWSNSHATRMVGQFDNIVVASQYAASEFGAAPNLHVVRLGVDTDLFSPRHRNPSWLGRLLPTDRRIVAMVGRLSDEKEPEVGIRAVERLRAKGVDVHLAVVGEGPNRRRLQALAGPDTTFLGHLADREELAALLASVDAVVSTCPRETFGLAVLEALASGTPVASVPGGAVPELLGSGGGVVARSVEPAALASALAHLLSEAGEDRAARRELARRTGLTHRWSRTVERMLELHGLGPSAAGEQSRQTPVVPAGRSDAPWW